MNENQWREKIVGLLDGKDIKDMLDSPAIDDAAQLASEADDTLEAYRACVKTDGRESAEAHRLLREWRQLKDQTLAAWRELCLTPKSYRQAVGEVRQDPSAEFMKLLSGIESGGTAKCGTTRE